MTALTGWHRSVRVRYAAGNLSSSTDADGQMGRPVCARRYNCLATLKRPVLAVGCCYAAALGLLLAAWHIAFRLSDNVRREPERRHRRSGVTSLWFSTPKIEACRPEQTGQCALPLQGYLSASAHRRSTTRSRSVFDCQNHVPASSGSTKPRSACSSSRSTCSRGSP